MWNWLNGLWVKYPGITVLIVLLLILFLLLLVKQRDFKVLALHMNNQLERLWSRHPALVTGFGFSLILLFLFLLAKQFEVKALTLEIQWIAISILPLALALLAGGYVQTFKGFGVELEARLEKTPVKSIGLTGTAKEAITNLSPGSKGDSNHLQELRSQRIDRLVFTEGKPAYYVASFVEEYFQRLNRLKYVEIQTLTHEFLCLIPAKLFFLSDSRQVNNQVVERFVQSLEDGDVLLKFGQDAIITVCESDSLVNALQKMRNNNVREAAVISSRRQCTGLLQAWKVEKYIANEVLSLSRSA